MDERHRFEDVTLAVLRIPAGLGYFAHRTANVDGWLKGQAEAQGATA